MDYGWQIVTSPTDDETHIIPTLDTEPHVMEDTCHCRPTWHDDACAFVHNSFDGREAFEHGGRKKS
jgi:hypothetical protein